MENQKQQVVERLQQANNILVTVSSNPSVDQLAACIGLTIALNKMGKHATAVFSGTVPSTIEFLQPEKTLEKNTDSLRDFIIALDKSKADKLRYKVEDRMVKIFITPYRTSISDKDLDFSQGDFNVDVVLALGVHNQNELDQAITSHGRILHDATVMTVNVKPGGELGSVNWLDAGASSLSELTVQLSDALDKKLLDGQIATAFLTGIIAETERFSNNKTSPQTMSISAELMSAGANQQLVATKLQEPLVAPQPAPIKQLEEPAAKPKEPIPVTPPKPDDGTIEIEHEKPAEPQITPGPVAESPEEAEQPQAPQIHIDEQGQLQPLKKDKKDNEDMLPPQSPLPNIRHEDGPKLLTDPEPPMLGSPMTANSKFDEEDEPSTDPLSLPSVGLLNREPLPSQQANKNHAVIQPLSSTEQKQDVPTPPTLSTTPMASPINPFQPPAGMGTTGPIITPPAVHPAGQPQPTPPSKTLSELEEEVDSPHLSDTSVPLMPTPAQPTSSVIQPQSPAASQPQAALPVAPPAGRENATNVDDARSAVEQALNVGGSPTDNPGAIQALNAQPLSYGLHDSNTPPAPIAVPPQPQQPVSFEPTPVITPQGNNGQNPSVAPPAVPPPMMPPSFPGQ